MKNRSSYSESEYGKMRNRIKEREEKEKNEIRNRVPYKYIMNAYGY